MNYILDAIVIGIILLTVYFSARHGFVRTVIEVVGFVAALVISFSLSTPLASATYDKMIEPSVISAVEKATSDGTQSLVDTTWAAFPKIITQNSEKLGLSKETLSQRINDNTSKGATAAAQTASQTVAKPIITRLLGMLYSTVLIVVLLFVVKILARWVNKLFSFSIIGKLNSALGGIVGVVKGIVVALAFCMLVTLIVSVSKGGFFIFTDTAIAQSSVFRFFASFSPFIG